MSKWDLKVPECAVVGVSFSNSAVLRRPVNLIVVLGRHNIWFWVCLCRFFSVVECVNSVLSAFVEPAGLGASSVWSSACYLLPNVFFVFSQIQCLFCSTAQREREREREREHHTCMYMNTSQQISSDENDTFRFTKRSCFCDFIQTSKLWVAEIQHSLFANVKHQHPGKCRFVYRCCVLFGKKQS